MYPLPRLPDYPTSPPPSDSSIAAGCASVDSRLGEEEAGDLVPLPAACVPPSPLPVLIFRSALIMPSNFILSCTTIPRANSRIARRPSLSCSSCHPASSPATVCCVYRSSFAMLAASSRDFRARSSFSSYSLCLVSSKSPKGHLDLLRELKFLSASRFAALI